MSETMTGIVSELGGAELGSTGKEKPRKVIIKTDPNQQYGKTFRVWSNSDAWLELDGKLGQTVTVEYNVEERSGPNGPYTQNFIIGTNAGGSPNGDDWSRPNGDQTPAPAATQTAPVSKDDYWARREATDAHRSLEMEAAWAVKAVLDRAGPSEVSPQKLEQDAIHLVAVKRRVAAEIGKTQGPANG